MDAPSPTPSSSTADAEPVTRAGYVAILGAPNAGKSTLLNRLVGERLSIVSARPQTTWRRITGIRSESSTQMIFLDTPGLLQPSSLIDRSLVEETRRGLQDADVVLVLLDASLGAQEQEAELEGLPPLLGKRRRPLVVAVNKVDVGEPATVEETTHRIRRVLEPDAVLHISALRGDGTDELLEILQEKLPESPFLYPEDELATAPVRFFVAELVRETVFEQFRDEIPYATFCRVEEFREEADRTYVQVTLFVERPSQKGILIGKRGAAMKALGQAARTKIEHFLGRAVYLDLWVKVLPRWRKKREHLRRLGFPVPDHDS